MSIKNLKPRKGNTGGYKQGYYKVMNPEKYVGDPNKIIFRSSYEKKFATYCDNNPKVVRWASEPFEIPYLAPDGKTRKYNVDFYVKIDQGDNEYKHYLVEVKPKRKLQKPNAPKRNITEAKMKKYYTVMKEWATNLSKFEAGKEYARQHGWDFLVVTEDYLF